MSDNKFDNLVDLDSLRETALDFSDAGFRVMRLHGANDDGSCMCGWEECKNALKHPSAKQWSNLPHDDEDAINSWFDMGLVKHGMGVVLDDDTVIVDVDEKNGGLESFEQLEKDLGFKLIDACTLIVDSGSGKGSRHYWFKKPQDIAIRKKVKEYKGLDFLSKGCFVVMPHSAHKSGNTYSFPYSKRSDPQKITEAPDELLSLIERKHILSESNAAPHSCDIAELREALMAIDADCDYEDWMKVCFALAFETEGSQEGYLLFDEWSSTGSSYTSAEETNKKWESATSSTPSQPVTGGTIFAMAIDAGWVRDYSKIVDLNPFLQRLETGEAQQQVIVKNDIQHKADDLPLVLQSIPGILGEISRYIMDTAAKPLYLPSLAAAITYCGVTLGRKYCTEQSNYSPLYLLNVAGTGTGKEHPRKTIKRLFVETGQTSVAISEPTSSGAIATALIDCPRILAIIDEFAHFLRSGNSKHASKNDTDVRAAFMELFGLNDSVYEPPKYSRMSEYKHGTESAEKVDLTIRNPSVSVLGMTTPAALMDNITRMMIADGFLNRFIVVQAHEGRQKMKSRKRQPTPQSIINWTEEVLKPVGEGSLAQMGLGDDVYNQKPQERVLDFSTQALQAISDFEDEIIERQNKLEREGKGLDELYSRTIEQAMRLSLIVQLSKNPISRTIDVNSVDWAIEFVKYNVTQLEKLIKFQMVENRQEGDHRDALKHIDRAKGNGIKQADLFKNAPFSGGTASYRKDILQYLVDTNQAFSHHKKPESGRGRPSIYWYSTKHAKLEDLESE